MAINSQIYATRSGGFLKKKPRHLDVMRSQHGQATQQVAKTKEQQQRDEETKFDQEMQTKSLALQQRQAHDERKQMNRQKSAGYANTGMNLLQTIMSFF